MSGRGIRRAGRRYMEFTKDVLSKIRDKSVTHSVFRVQDYDCIMRGFYWITFREYMLSGETLFNYTNLFSPSDYKKNDKIKYKYFKDKYVKFRV